MVHMLLAAKDAIGFVEGRSRPALGVDPMFTRALVQAVQTIGEAASRVTVEGRARASGVPWAKIVGMRHILVHDYWMIDYDLVWTVATRDLDGLVGVIERALAAWPEQA